MQLLRSAASCAVHRMTQSVKPGTRTPPPCCSAAAGLRGARQAVVTGLCVEEHSQDDIVRLSRQSPRQHGKHAVWHTQAHADPSAAIATRVAPWLGRET